MAVTVQPLADACGAEILGVDLRQPLSPDDRDAIHRAWLDHCVIVVRDQRLTGEDQQRFAAAFGPVGAYLRPKELQNPEYASDQVMLISNIRENGKPIGSLPDGEMMWHTDTGYAAHPHKATTLFAVEIPDRGGDTLFSNQYMVYDALPDRLKESLAGRKAMNVFEFGTTVKAVASYDRARAPHHAHPVFRKHPETGRTCVYVCPLMTEEIIGLEPQESRAALDEIFALQGQERFVFRHRWRVGDLVMWDNRCTMHAREDFPRDQRRLLTRVTIEDEAPVLNA